MKSIIEKLVAKKEYDLLVIGAGAAGNTAASTAAKDDTRVALVERDKIGGTCLNYGCDPTKTLIHIARLLYHAGQANQFGLHFSGAEADWASVMSWVREVILRIRSGTSEEASAEMSRKGIDVLSGEATFISPHEVPVGDILISAARIIIAAIAAETLASIIMPYPTMVEGVRWAADKI